MRLKIILLSFILLFLAGCSSEKTWTGYYYPDKNNIGDEKTWVIQPGFENIDYCREWVDNVAKDNQNYDYECGYNCTYRQEYKMNVCEKTEK